MKEQIIETMLRNDATPQIKGIMYQFMVALKYCFQLKDGQTLYVEHFGDIAIQTNGTTTLGDAIEVKMYEDNLTIQHHNFLNTIYNWLQEDFDVQQYNHLILFTTQPMSKKGWEDWGKLNVTAKLSKLKETYSTYQDKHKNEDKISTLVSKNLEQIQYVLEHETKLKDILEKLQILYEQPNFEELYNEFCDTYLAMISNNAKLLCLCSFLGYVISSIHRNPFWSITYTQFNSFKETLVARYGTRTIRFPDIPLATPDTSNYSEVEYPFVIKLKDIAISGEEFNDCVCDFARVASFLEYDYKEPILPEDIQTFQKKLADEYKLKRRIALAEIQSCDSSNNILTKSQTFMWKLFLDAQHNIPFKPFDGVEQYVYNGMYHHMANELDYIKWRLQ